MKNWLFLFFNLKKKRNAYEYHDSLSLECATLQSSSLAFSLAPASSSGAALAAANVLSLARASLVLPLTEATPLA